MTSRISIPIHNRFLRNDTDGSIVTGSLQFYEAGTTTPVAVYSDPDLTVLLGSSIDTDSAGLLPDFHVPADQAIKIRAYDDTGGQSGSGAVLWTTDNVWPDSSNIDARLDSLESSINSLDSGYRNVVLNGGMQVQLGSDVTISGSYQEGKVTGVEAKAANATNGTITGQTDIDTASGYEFAVNNLTTPNASDTLETRITVNSQDSARFVDSAATFSCLVEQNTGNPVDYTITVSKADSQDDFSSTTQIATSASATSVASGTKTRLELSIPDMSDCSNGIGIVVQSSVGAVTTKDFHLTEAQLEPGENRTDYEQRNFQVDRAALDGLLGTNNLSELGDAKTSRDNLAFATDYITGLLIESAADTDHDITVNTGRARDATDTANMILSSALTKQLDAAWAEGDNAGGQPSGVTLSGPESLHVFVISKTDGTVDAGFDTDSSATNLLSDASSYSYYRKIGVIITDSSNNLSQVCSYPVIDAQVFASSGTWNKPSDGYASDTAVFDLVAGGASGHANRGGNDTAYGGSGGGFVRASIFLSSLSASESVTVGSGGAAQSPASSSSLAGQDGGDTSFAGYTAKGGNGGSSAQASSGFQLPSFPNEITDKWGFASGGSTLGNGEDAIFAGGGGGTADGADSAGGTSWQAGDGGVGDNATSQEANGGDGETPGGGGGGAQAPNNHEATSGAGGDGQAVIYVIRGWADSGIRGDVC